jgi:hypothetical protein
MSSTSVAPVEPGQAPRHSAGLRASIWGAVVLLAAGYVTYRFFESGAEGFVDADAQRVIERQKILADRLAEDQKLLHGTPSWFAKDKGFVRVPIDDAIQMTLVDLAKIQPHAAYAISSSPPQPASALQNYGTRAPGAAKKPAPSAPASAASAAPSATPAPAPSATPAPTATPTPAPTPTPTPIPTPTPTPIPTPVPAASAAPAPVADTPAPAETPSPAPSATATPVESPAEPLSSPT